MVNELGVEKAASLVALRREQHSMEPQGMAADFQSLLLCLAVIFAALWFYILKRIFYSDFLDKFHDKFLVITGCDSGFGKAFAVKLDQLGFNVFATCLTSDGEEELRRLCSKRLKTIRLDVRKSEEIAQAVKEVRRSLPAEKGIWGLVNNAGIAKVGPIEWQSLEDIKDVADVNLWGLVDVTKQFLPLLKIAQGRIVNMASIAGRACLPHASAYCISKFGVEAFSDGLRRELGPSGVKVSIIEPGFFKTNITDKDRLRNTWSQLWHKLSPSLRQEYGEKFYQTSVSNMLKGMVDTCASPRIGKVVDVIVHALASSRPKTRYVVGWDAHLLWVWISRLPATVGDVILSLLGEKVLPSGVEERSKTKTLYSNGVNGHIPTE